ncbi:hypothetical protein EC957_007327 [Mortierella hygrophila]|uniref:Uncharacterized protein n=1 Tax=Mortierella hygrophila TaxID=979708 RepID=A0A9P6FD18_9FUNG|nr:hypothetical protein EC957_007327 [Mortierella hygrophila]
MATNGSSFAIATRLNRPSEPESDLRSKHLSQPYNMQSISTESLPVLFGAASLRRSNSNVSRTSRNNTSSPVPSSTNTSYSTPSSPAHPLASSKTAAFASSTSGSKSNGVSGTSSSSGRSSSPKHQSGASQTTATATTTTPMTSASPRRLPIDMISEQFEIEGSHDRRPSSWDIMDMMAIDQLRQWLVCFCVVNFDLEKGQGKFP